ncbi:hypothetical protein P280DRAFT_294072 [Massarina eburnea CBS 473.64]|uniref:Uncharacterized protein n=1 Tax=Massarina eburnea CBS 473.64 TaxID=1395130 RepID=A0A6A6S3L7_9PLEO|nr:hypothetical protein P280DRAFT_294072 [Massarina eburnea CBS 473.64]
MYTHAVIHGSEANKKMLAHVFCASLLFLAGQWRHSNESVFKLCSHEDPCNAIRWRMQEREFDRLGHPASQPCRLVDKSSTIYPFQNSIQDGPCIAGARWSALLLLCSRCIALAWMDREVAETDSVPERGGAWKDQANNSCRKAMWQELCASGLTGNSMGGLVVV